MMKVRCYERTGFDTWKQGNVGKFSTLRTALQGTWDAMQGEYEPPDRIELVDQNDRVVLHMNRQSDGTWEVITPSASPYRHA